MQNDNEEIQWNRKYFCAKRIRTKASLVFNFMRIYVFWTFSNFFKEWNNFDEFYIIHRFLEFLDWKPYEILPKTLEILSNFVYLILFIFLPISLYFFPYLNSVKWNTNQLNSIGLCKLPQKSFEFVWKPEPLNISNKIHS